MPSKLPALRSSALVGGLALVLVTGCSQSGVAPVAAERYPVFSEAAPADPVRLPLSTFSIDVDTASYATVRRHIDDGHLPPPDAVRIEEMINAFDYGYPDPEDGRPLALTTEVGPCPWNADRRLLLVGLQGARLTGERVPPLNLTFLVDVSGSMKDDDKLPLLVDALEVLVERLRRTDTVSIVTYASETGVALAPTPGNQRERILDVLESLRAGGSTDGAGGLELAYATNHGASRPGGVDRIILCTDGDFNVGLSTPEELGAYVARQREGGTDLTVLGFGSGNLHDANLQALVHHGNGNAHYVDSLDEARRVLSTDAGGTLVTVARDVKIQVEFNPAAVGSYRLIGYETRALADEAFDDDREDAGDLGVGRAVTALYEIAPAGARPSDPGLRYARDATPGDVLEAELARVSVRYRVPGASRSERIEAIARERLPDGTEASADLRFASAVAAFGLALRDSPFRGKADFAMARDLAEGARGEDPDDAREDFEDLVADAADLAEDEGDLRFR